MGLGVAATNRFDINRDGRVASADRLLVMANLSAIGPLILLDLTGSPALQDAIVPARGLPVRSLEAVEGGLRVRWLGEGRPVRIQTSSLLVGDEWETYDELPSVGPEGEEREIVLPVDPEDRERYYRLESLVAPVAGER